MQQRCVFSGCSRCRAWGPLERGFDDDLVRQALRLEDDILPIAILSLGWPEKIPIRPERTKRVSGSVDRLAAGLRNIAEAILKGEIKDEAALEAAKKRVSSQLRLSSLPSNADILGQGKDEEREL